MPETKPAGSEAEILRLSPSDARWPRLWRHIADPPGSVYLQGDGRCLNSPALAIVGTRRATHRGLAIAEGLARSLALRGWTIVSGMALGIDGAAHRGALAAGGRTIAVMGTGPDLVYPRAHRGLHREIAASGCVITELEPGCPPLRNHFPRRNRLIAGLAQAVIVVEAPLQSGAMHTANVALDYDREVFAVPGPVDQDAHRGCHRLLRDGACLIESGQDVDRVLGVPEGTLPPQEHGNTDLFGGALDPAPGSSARWIMDRLDLEGIRRDHLRQRWPGDEQNWIAGLTALELAGLIKRLPGGIIARRVWTCT